jgi:hypothetical protein
MVTEKYKLVHMTIAASSRDRTENEEIKKCYKL